MKMKYSEVVKEASPRRGGADNLLWPWTAPAVRRGHPAGSTPARSDLFIPIATHFDKYNDTVVLECESCKVASWACACVHALVERAWLGSRMLGSETARESRLRPLGCELLVAIGDNHKISRWFGQHVQAKNNAKFTLKRNNSKEAAEEVLRAAKCRG
jgi:hypothetical protein